MILGLPLFLAILQAGPLETCVGSYWELLSRGDKAGALAFVTEQTRNHFIQRREPAFRGWQLTEIVYRDESTARVSVEIERILPGVSVALPLQVHETWLLENNSWRVSVVQPTPAILDSVSAARRNPQRPALDGKISVLPQTLKIHFLDKRRTGLIRLGNGFATSAQVVQIEYDETRFEVVEAPSSIGAAEYGDFRLRYTGHETAKELTSQLRIVLEAEQRIDLSVPILFNHLSPGARGLFGLDHEGAESLESGKTLVPVLKKPED